MNAFQENEDFVGFEEPEPVETKKRRRDSSGSDHDTRKEERQIHNYSSEDYLSLMTPDVPWYSEETAKKQQHPIVRLHQEIIDFDAYISPSGQEKKARSAIVSRVENVIRKLWPKAKVLPFGSFYTELYLPTSDIDLVCTNGASSNASGLRKIAKGLIAHNLVQKGSLKVITKARVPIVKFTERLTNYTVDISFNQESGPDGSDHIRTLLVQWPALRPLLMVLKQFLLTRSLNEVYSGGLGSYALTLMIVHFLQLHPMIQAGWILPEDNLGVLLLEFFELYGKCLNYERIGISILNQGTYFDKAGRNWYVPTKPHLLSIEDPYNPDNDVTKSSFSIQTVKQSFAHAYDLMTNLISILTHRKDRPQGSLLSAIMSLDSKTILHRSYIDDLDDSAS